jgi:hypothetical protein
VGCVNDSLLYSEADACLRELENCIFYLLNVECNDVIVSTRIVFPSTKLFRFATALLTTWIVQSVWSV